MFESNPAKSAANKAKHGIDFETAEVIWQDGRRIDIAAHLGGDGERRRIVIGAIGEKLWSAIITYREGKIRFISVRRARDDERGLYHDRGV